MKVMYVVSPDYLLPFEKESKEYSFYIQGYRDFISDPNVPHYKSGISELYKTNINDIVGFIILVNDIGDYIKEIDVFLQEVDKVCVNNKRRVVVGSIISKADRHLSTLSPTPNIDLFRVSNISILTDHIIKRELFGTVIKGRVPYTFLGKDTKETKPKEIPRLKYRPIFSKRLLSVLDSVAITSDDLQKLLSYDSIYRQLLEEGDKLLAFIRMLKISSSSGVQFIVKTDEYKNIIEEIENSPNNLLYKALIKQCGGYNREC